MIGRSDSGELVFDNQDIPLADKLKKPLFDFQAKYGFLPVAVYINPLDGCLRKGLGGLPEGMGVRPSNMVLEGHYWLVPE